MQAGSTATRATGWLLFVLVAGVAVYFFGFVAFAVLCAVIGVSLFRAGWSAPKPWVRASLWIAAAAVLALPVLMFWEVAGSYPAITVS